MIINQENLFLIILAIVWIIGAILQDLKRREVDNIWNFSLIAFALAYRLFISISHGNYWFLLNGLLGFILALALANLFYYSRLFAGGDAKLLISLGAILPLTYDWIFNLKIFGAFVLLFFLAGSIYVLIWSFFLVILNFKRFKKEFVKEMKNYKIMFISAIIFFLIWIILSIVYSNYLLSLIGSVVLLFPILLTYAKSIEESCLVKPTPYNKVTEGDWLYEDIIVNGKKIKANWDGVSRKELEQIRKYCRKKILIKQGIPFTPSFLFAFLILLYLDYKKFNFFQ